MTPKRVDANQAQIVKELRQIGFSVLCIHEIGRGAPDILVAHLGINYLFEIKDPVQVPSQRKLTPDEARWHARWKGQVAIVHSVKEILDRISK